MEIDKLKEENDMRRKGEMYDEAEEEFDVENEDLDAYQERKQKALYKSNAVPKFLRAGRGRGGGKPTQPSGMNLT